MPVTTEATDLQYIADIQAGGRNQEISIKKLYEQYFYLIRVGRKKYPKMDEDDLLTAYNATIISFRKHILNQGFRGNSSIATYLNRIFFNKCIDILRKHSSNKEDSGYESLPEFPDTTHTPSILKQIYQEEKLKRVMRLLGHLGGVCKKIIIDAEYWGYNATEIAERVGFSNSRSVSSKKYDCLKRLSKMVASQNG